MKTIQVFTNGGGDFCEVDGQLISYSTKDGFITIKSREGDDGAVWTHVFPASYLHMVRIHDVKGNK